MKQGYISLETLKDGAALELVNNELVSVLENILDPNTDPKATRKIQLELVFKPGEDREAGKVTIKCKSCLAPTADIDATVFFGRDSEGLAVAAEYGGMNPNQHVLTGMPPAVPEDMTTATNLETTNTNVTPLKRAQGAN